MKRAMKDSIFNVLEQMFYLTVDVRETGENSEAALLDTSLISSSVEFAGPCDGMFMLSIPVDLATSMAVDFLGVSTEMLSSEQITGTVKEMVNMLAGSTLGAYAPESAFDLHIPELIAASQRTKSDSEPDNSMLLLIETPDNRMVLRLYITGNGNKNSNNRGMKIQ
jgi:CheY-specific phosphatase CheX